MSDIAPAIIAGSIGLVSAGLSYAMAQRQLSRNEREADAGRAHALALLVMTRRLESIEVVWLQLFRLEQGKRIGDDIDTYIRASVWLPTLVRDRAINVLRGFESTAKSSPDLARELSMLRSELATVGDVNVLRNSPKDAVSGKEA